MNKLEAQLTGQKITVTCFLIVAVILLLFMQFYLSFFYFKRGFLRNFFWFVKIRSNLPIILAIGSSLGVGYVLAKYCGRFWGNEIIIKKRNYFKTIFIPFLFLFTSANICVATYLFKSLREGDRLYNLEQIGVEYWFLFFVILTLLNSIIFAPISYLIGFSIKKKGINCYKNI